MVAKTKTKIQTVMKKGGTSETREPMYMSEKDLDTFLSVNAKTFTEAEMEVVKKYLREGYDINEGLRCDDIDDEYLEVIEKIDSAFKPIEIRQSFCLFRGVPSPLRFMMEKKLCDKAYCSTSKSFQIGQQFMTYEDAGEKCCVFHIHFEKGHKFNMIPVKYSENNAHTHEQEILFPRNTELTVITDIKLLNEIGVEMGYTLLSLANSKCQDRLADCDGVYNSFGFQVFQKDDGKTSMIVIPVQVVQSNKAPKKNVCIKS